ncbi:signal peptidase I [Cellulomonas sp. PS-H5]|uniref:signal peptidase I n=1 Tax=Cellulomonas sp. PS-H5 TaxID=2820400 RepID=UPI001C4EB5CE|nr:signal peptidase I [Cellulomonas sp. PS-H5]MBW0254835.1 signal peptidase I [Cellulomonas sp. PS-H5]
MTTRPAPRALLAAQRVLLDVAAVVGVVSLLAVAACLLLGVRPAIVLSGSMSPAIPVGALTLARTVPADTVEVGDVVTVPRHERDGLVTHRVVQVTPAGTAAGTAGGPAVQLRLQGDANDEPDALPYTVTEAGRVLWSVPQLGRVVAALQEHVVLVVALLVGITALATFPVRRDGDDAGAAPRG